MSREITIKERVHMENEKRKILNKIDPLIKSYFKQYDKQKIYTVQGELLKKIKDDKIYNTIVNRENYSAEPLPGDHVDINIFMQHSQYSFYVTVKLCFSGGSYEDRTNYTVYTETGKYIADLENGTTIKSLYELSSVPLLNHIQENMQIQLFIKKSKELKEILKTIDYSLRDFIKYEEVRV